MKLALILNAINPAIGGVLIRGEKGTGKSTAVRALASLLPDQEVVVGCSFGCHPRDLERMCERCRQRSEKGDELESGWRQMKVVELPINASEDRVVGTIDMEVALKEGAKRFEPGVLAEANRNVLYVDEVNLLDDHIVDVLLDAAAMGVNVVEREGISVSHPSRFILVGTMNPEEGELRPQLLDRFGLCVDVEGIKDLDQRVEIVSLEAAFSLGQRPFMHRSGHDDALLSRAMSQASQALAEVHCAEPMLRLIARISSDHGVSGHRADLVMERASRALAAWHGRSIVLAEDVQGAARLALAHRASQQVAAGRPTEAQGEAEPASGDGAGEPTGQQSTRSDGNGEQSAANSDGHAAGSDAAGHLADQEQAAAQAPQTATAAGEQFAIQRIELERQRTARRQAGRRLRSPSTTRRGRYVRAEVRTQVDDLAIDATIRAAATQQISRGRRGGPLLLSSLDLRQKVRERKSGHFIVFVVDASASMDAEQRMAATKGAVMSLLQDAYLRRDRVAVVVFKNRSAEVVLSPTSSVAAARSRLQHLTVGGTTPLTHGLLAALKVIRTERLRDPSVRALLVLISDGRGNISMFRNEPLVEAQEVAAMIAAEHIEGLVIDSGKDHNSRTAKRAGSRFTGFYDSYLPNACVSLAERMGARYCGLYDLSRDEITRAVSHRLGQPMVHHGPHGG